MTTAARTAIAPSIQTGEDFLPLQGVDHLEFYVGNAHQAAHFYRMLFGFNITAYRGLETGDREKASYVIEQGKIRFILTTALHPDNPVARHVQLHGDGVKAIAMTVNDVDKSIEAVRSRHATIVMPPYLVEDEHGTWKSASIKAYGDTIHTFVERKNYKGVFAPGFVPFDAPPGITTGLAAVDHMVGNVELGAMNHWVDFYARVMGFHQLAAFSDEDISTEYSALMSKVMENGTGKIKFPINEPAEGKKKSQIEEYLDYYHGPGVQHIAMNTGDIAATVRALRANGIKFLRVPDTYYESLPNRIGKINEDLAVLKELGILVDRDEDGYLLQIFTRPVEDRPTLFFEIIERHGSRGFGIGNFKALFVSIEEEQQKRGNL